MIQIVCLALGFLAMLMPQPALAAEPGDFKIRIQLIWGSNDEKPEEARLKDLDPLVKAKFQNFKWKNYWEVRQTAVSVGEGKTNKVVVSKPCEVEIRHLDKQIFEVNLYGEKKLVAHHARENLANGHPLIIAGHDKNDTAWFVMLTLVTPPAPNLAPKKVPSAEKAVATTNKQSKSGP